MKMYLERWLKIVTCSMLCASLSGLLMARTTAVEQANKDGILLVGIGPDPEGLDPHLVTGVTEQNVLRALFEGLVTPDPKTLEPLPGMAEEWDISSDLLTYTFYLRKDAKWSNDDPLTATDFIFSIKRILNKSLGASGVSSIFVIKNAKAFYEGTVPFDQVGVKALNENALQISLEAPTPYFLSLLMMPAYYPVHAKTLEKFNSVQTRNNAWTKAENMVCNGPFYLKSYQIGKMLEVSKNPYYWNAKNVSLNGVRFYPIADVATEERAFRNGQLHITEIVPYAKLLSYAAKNLPELKLSPYLMTYYYLLNIHIKPLDDVRVRRALALSIDRESLAGSDQMRVKHRSAYSLVPEGCAGFVSKTKVKEDVATARKLLAEAGFPNGQGFPKLKLLFNTSEGQTYLAAAVQEMWKKNLNIDTELVNQEWKVYLNSRRSRDFQIARGGWVGDYNDPTTFLDLWVSNANNNFVGWSNANFDKLLQEASHTTDKAKRLECLQEAESLLLTEMPLIPIHSSNTSHLVEKSVKNWFGTLLDWHPYQYITLESK